MDYIEFLALYNAFNDGYRHAHYDKIFTNRSKKIIKNIMKVDGISREEAGMKLIKMCKENNFLEIQKYYV
jgi:hypothetical protein